MTISALYGFMLSEEFKSRLVVIEAAQFYISEVIGGMAIGALVAKFSVMNIFVAVCA